MHKNNKILHMDYNLQNETTLKGIGIGYIIQCNANDSIGFIYGAVNSENNEQLIDGTIAKIFYFKKNRATVYPPFTIVSYLRERTSCSYPDKTIEVTHVINIKDFITYYPQKDYNEILRSNGRYYFEQEWQLIKNAKPYAEIVNNDICIHHPIVNENEKTVEYYTFYAFNSLKNATQTILGCYYFMKENHKYKRPISMDYLFLEFKELKEYINSFNIDEEIKTFTVGESGTFQCRPGRDDHFNIIKYCRSSSLDPYIKQLVPLKEDFDYYVLNGRGEEEQDYDIIDEAETNTLRNAVKNAYNKDAHFSFLLLQSLASIRHKADLYGEATLKIQKFINKKDFVLFSSNGIDINSYIEYINKFNKQFHRVTI